MKKVLLVAAFAVSVLGYSQSNDQGTIQINLLGGFSFGGKVTDKATATFENKSYEDYYNFASGTYGLNVHYGLNKKISLGLGLSSGRYILKPILNRHLERTTTMSLFNIGAQSRYYLLNEEYMNVYGGVNVGFASATDEFVGYDLTIDSFKASGLSYGVNFGLNYYIWGNVGGSIQLGYEGAALSGDFNFDGGSIPVKRSIGGINISTGLAIKIN